MLSSSCLKYNIKLTLCQVNNHATLFLTNLTTYLNNKKLLFAQVFSDTGAADSVKAESRTVSAISIQEQQLKYSEILKPEGFIK